MCCFPFLHYYEVVVNMISENPGRKVFKSSGKSLEKRTSKISGGLDERTWEKRPKEMSLKGLVCTLCVCE